MLKRRIDGKVKMKKLFNIIFIFFSISLLTACQAHLPRQILTGEIQRSDETPLVVAIPGLDSITLDQTDHFGDLTQLMDADGIPSVVILYDDKHDPIQADADLSSTKNSITVLRILPRLVTAISQENQIRKMQNAPPLKRLILVTYSQGGVLAWDMFQRFSNFKNQLEKLEKTTGSEWDQFKKEALFQAFNDEALAFFMVDDIKTQDLEKFKEDIDFQNLYYRIERNLKNALERLNRFMRPATGSAPYPKLVKCIDKAYGGALSNKINTKNLPEAFNKYFVMQYATFHYLLPLEIDMFSITGSFFGSPKAFMGYYFSEVAPRLAAPFIGHRQNQLKDTRLGGVHHLKWMKEVLAYKEQHSKEPLVKNIHFIVGVNGRSNTKGDKLVEQSAAHLSDHRFAQIQKNVLLNQTEASGTLTLSWEALPIFPVTGLGVPHLPHKAFFITSVDGAAQMNDKSKVYPFLKAFVEEEETVLSQLHDKNNKPLEDFMVSIYPPETEGDYLADSDLESLSKEIKIEKKYINPISKSVTWTGYFKKKSQAPGKVLLKASLGKDRKAEIVVPIYPGKNSFIEITE